MKMSPLYLLLYLHYIYDNFTNYVKDLNGLNIKCKYFTIVPQQLLNIII